MRRSIFLGSAWAAERLAACTEHATAVQEQPLGTHRVRVRLTLHGLVGGGSCDATTTTAKRCEWT